MVGNLDDARMHARDALAAAERLRDHSRVALCCTTLAQTLVMSGCAVEALPIASRAVQAARAARAERAQLGAHTVLGLAEYAVGNYRAARACFEASLTAIRSDSLDWTSLPRLVWMAAVNALAWLALSLVELGAFDEALNAAHRANEQVDSRQSNPGIAKYALAYARFRRGERDARAGLEQGLALARETSWLVLVVPYLAALGSANVQEGRVAEGLALLEDALAELARSNRAQQSLFLAQLSDAYLAAGRPEDALRAARDGLSGARKREERGDEAWISARSPRR